jgi:hypothetical protein
MNVRATDLEQVLDEVGVPEKVYAVLVTDVGRGTQISVEVEARCDVSAAATARYLYYSTHGRPLTAIHTRTVCIWDDVSWRGDDILRMGV